MKLFFVAFLFAASAFAQNSSSACGPENVNFNVTLDKSRAPMPKLEPRKTLVVFIQDLGEQKFGIGVHVTARIGVDGAWVGAVKDNSYLPVSIEQGDHHICVNLNSELLGNPVEFTHLRVEAGTVYYLRWRYLPGGNLLLAPADSDEAKYQIALFPLSVSTPKR
jgi:hypothetical protein